MPAQDYHEIKDEWLQRRLRALAAQISEWVPDNWGFTIFLFGYGDNAPLFYISSAQREDMIRTVEEWLETQRKVSP